MRPFVQSKIDKLRNRLSDRSCEFKPYIGALKIESCPLRFFYGTPRAAVWYPAAAAHPDRARVAGTPRRRPPAATIAASFLGMHSQRNNRREPKRRAASMIDRELPNAAECEA